MATYSKETLKRALYFKQNFPLTLNHSSLVTVTKHFASFPTPVRLAVQVLKTKGKWVSS